MLSRHLSPRPEASQKDGVSSTAGAWAARGLLCAPEAAALAQEALLEGRGQTSETQLAANVKNYRGLYSQTVFMLF